jgi:NADH:ubiquinone oxidoreductase subunit 2 (subunit N)
MYIEKPTPEQSAVPPIRTSNCAGAVLAVCTVGMLALGLLPQVLRWVETAAAAGF